LNPTPVPDEIATALDAARGRLGPLGVPLIWYDETGSTNDRALAWAEAGVAEGALVLADAQSRGRGRLGRAWASPGGAGVYASVVLRPPRHAASLLTIAAGVAIAEGIEAASGLSAQVKWPNDVVMPAQPPAFRKLAGILAEAGAGTSGDVHVVLGFGINVRPAAYPPDVRTRATSLEDELGRPVTRGPLIAECLAALWSRYGELRAGRTDETIAAWRARATATFGRAVEWDDASGRHTGRVRDIDGGGALIIDAGDRVVRVTSGEVRWTV
jgi:BirA family biotin operon repressor/biotin-[acetyl-CoA-carboxylase] ligase